jgi:hypothetical protein
VKTVSVLGFSTGGFYVPPFLLLQDASIAAGLARDKLIERQEKLEAINQQTQEMQVGAENFASTAAELAKKMETRKWYEF